MTSLEPSVVTEKNNIDFNEVIESINTKYLAFLNELQEKFKYHEYLLGFLESDIKNITNNLSEDSYYILDSVTENFLFCLEQISDYNSDYFVYQVEKIKKKNGKVFKNRLSRFGSKTLLKKVLSESDNKYHDKIFKTITDIFHLLTTKDEEGNITFMDDYVDYVKDNYEENKNYSKMLIILDNVNNMLNSNLQERFANNELTNENIEDDVEEKKTKDKKKSKGGKSKIDPNFIKNLENSKIGQLAKNISEKINIEDYPEMSDPSKLFSSFMGGAGAGAEGGDQGGIQNLLKFVIDEVQGAFKDNKIDQSDLINEAQNMMGSLKDLAGIDPMSLLGKNGGAGLADIFSKMSK